MSDLLWRHERGRLPNYRTFWFFYCFSMVLPDNFFSFFVGVCLRGPETDGTEVDCSQPCTGIIYIHIHIPVSNDSIPTFPDALCSTSGGYPMYWGNYFVVQIVQSIFPVVTITPPSVESTRLIKTHTFYRHQVRIIISVYTMPVYWKQMQKS